MLVTYSKPDSSEDVVSGRKSAFFFIVIGLIIGFLSPVVSSHTPVVSNYNDDGNSSYSNYGSSSYSSSKYKNSNTYENKSDGKVGDNNGDGKIDEDDWEEEWKNFLGDKMKNY